LELAKQLELQL
jgi:chromosome segregation ATPase